MRAVLLLAGKDLRQRVRDRSAILIAVVVPLGLATIFNLVFGAGATPEPFRYAVVDADNGAVSRSFVEHVLNPLADKKIITLRRVGSAAEAERLTRDGAVDAAFVLPAGLTAAATGGSGAAGGVPAGGSGGSGAVGGVPAGGSGAGLTAGGPGGPGVVGGVTAAATGGATGGAGAGGGAGIDVLRSIDAPTAGDVAEAIASSFAAELNSTRVAALTATGDGTDPAAIAAAASQAAQRAAPVALADVSARGKILDTKTFFAASMAVFFLFFTVQFGVSSLIDERANGTLHRLVALPIRPGAVLGAKLVTSVVLGVASMAVLVVASSLLIGASWGDPLGVAALVVSGVLAATGITAVVASLARTAEQAGSWQAVTATLLGLLGGAFFPVAQVGGALEAVSLLTPHAWFLRGLGELAGGGGLADVLPATGAMLLFGAVTGAVALTRLSGMVRP